MTTMTSSIRHVASADDVRQPFDWSKHTTTDDGDCWCGPDAEVRAESDANFRERIYDAIPQWGALVSEVSESNGSALDDCGRSVGLVRGEVTEYVHQRPVEHGIDGSAKVVSRWA